jgi:CRP-like cAMP-binding protein
LVDQGETVSHIHFILKGHAQAFTYSEDGKRFWVADFGPGDMFGHPETLSNAPIEYEVRADTDMKLAVLPAKTFSDMMLEAPKMGKNVSLDLAASLGRANTRLFELATLSAAARICAELHRMAKPIGKTPDTWIIRPNPVYSNFALRVLSTRETVSRTISKLQKQGIVTRETGALVILKPDRLRPIS